MKTSIAVLAVMLWAVPAFAGDDPGRNVHITSDRAAVRGCSSVGLVTDDSYKDKEGNMVDRSEWHNIVIWGKPAEIVAQYMKKGRQIYLEGKLQSRAA